ncbi:MAG: Carnitine operon protein CaiE [Alphaproteobacteria bacterium MarineAlpha6_Bin1]|nr:MAG: Carnitine operon protein CaiE [Alphaproteobacteria bacterium MarineAlpha6_Bin1]
MIIKYKQKKPKIDKNVFVAPGSYVVGDVQIGSKSNIWFNVVIRGDVEKIRIGKNTNIQDLTMVHCTTKGFGTTIGSNVTIGHNCVIHDCTINDNSLIGMSSTILDGAVVEKNSMLAAGSLLTQGKIVKSGEIWAGNPAKLLRKLNNKEIGFFKISADRYFKMSKEYLVNFT